MKNTNKTVKSPKVLNWFQESLLDKTGVAWSSTETGIDIDVEQLSTEDFVELLGAGCFTYRLEYEGIPGEEMHKLHFEVAKKYAHKFVGEDTPMRSDMVIRKSIVQERSKASLKILVHPITKNGVDEGMYHTVWGDA